MNFAGGYLQAVRNGGELMRRQSTYHPKTLNIQKKVERKYKGKFVFEPPKAIETQVQEFFEMIKENDWDSKIGIKGYKGTFKVEHFMMIETKLRKLYTIRELSIIDTQMDKEHLFVLQSWISWLRPQKLTLEFQQNEIDDQDIESFVYFIFERQIDIKRLFIISNPGIYKGTFLKNLKQFIKETNQQHPDFEYRLIKNKDSKSIAIIRLNSNCSDEINQEKVQMAIEKIDKTCFYSFHLDSCFNDTNCGGFEHLISQTYDLDNLEQICFLDVSNNFLGTLSSFQVSCQSLSTAKGLLELHLKKQPLIENSIIVNALVGDRYDKLRVNHLNIENNSAILEKTFIIFSNALFPECKTINLNNCLSQQLSTLYKMGVMIEGFKNQIEQLKIKSKQAGKLIKMNLENLDLSLMENYNRHDLVEKFLNVLVFNEYCNLKELFMQNCDIGRLEAWRNTFIKFKERIEKESAQNPLLKGYQLPIKTFTMPKQTYRMEPVYIKKFFQEFCLTKKGGILEVENLNLISCFRQNGREEGLLENVEEIYNGIQDQKEPFISTQYTLKKLKMEDTTCDMSLTTYKCFLLTRNFSLQELTFKQDGWKEDFDIYYKETLAFLNKQPSNFIHSLKSLNLIDVSDFQIEAYKFIQLFIYNDQIKLKQLTLQSLNIVCESENLKILEETIANKTQNFYISLQNLRLEDIKEESSQCAFLKYVILSKFQQIEQIHLGDFKFDNHSTIIKQFAIDAESNQLKIFPSLKQLCLKGGKIEQEQTWDILQKYFICNKGTNLQELQFEKINLDAKFCQALQKYAEQILTEIIELTKQNDEQIQVIAQKKHEVNKNQDIQQIISDEIQQLISPHLLKIKKLVFIECEFDKEFLLGFWTISKINELIIQKCKGVEQSLKQSIDGIKNIPEVNLYNNCYPQVLTFEQITLNHQILEDFLDLVVFNLEFQQIKHLSFISCEFGDNHLKVLAQQIHKIRSNIQYKRYYNLRTINLNGNGKISKEVWVDFFSKLMEKKGSHQQKDDEKNSKSEEENSEVDKNDQSIEIKKPKEEDEKNEDDEKQKLLEEEITIVNDDIQKQISLKELNLRNKVISNNQIFKPNFLQNMKKLSLQCNFESFTPEQSVQIYFKIVFGLIINPESELMELKLASVDLTHLMEGVHMAQQLTSVLLLSNVQNVKTFVSKLIKIDLEVKQSTPESVQSFIKTFLCSNHIELKTLILSGFKNAGVISEILKQKNNRTNYALGELSVLSIEETLTETESFDFINSFILGNVFPIKILRLGEQIILKKPQLYELTLNKNIVPLEEFRGTVSENEDQVSVYQSILELLFQSNCNLKQLWITKKGSDANKVLQNVFELISQDHSLFFSLQEFMLDGKVLFDKLLADFIFRSIKSLKKLRFDDLAIENKEELEEYFKEMSIDFPQRNESALEIKKLSGAGVGVFLDNFLFNDKIGFWRLHLKSSDLLPQIQQINQINQIKSLKLDMGLLYNSSTQLNEKVLTLLAEKFIYNQESYCQELFLFQLHLKPAGVKALTKPAQSFREEQEKQNSKSICQLNLKSIVFYYSLYLGDEGCEILFRDLYFFEYINLEKLAFLVTNFNDRNCSDLVKYGKQWFQFQKENNRQFKAHHSLKSLDVGRNEFVQDRKVWKEYLNFSVFSNEMSLETFNMHFMAINDTITQYIVEEGLKFFETKPKNYKLSVKRINFSQNNALTAQGWKNIFENFFLHPKVDLLELNMISTMLDSEEKLKTIYECFRKKAQLYPNKKIPMQIFLCYNVTLKDMIYPFMQPPPKESQEPKDMPVPIDYTSFRYGIHDGIPEEYGEKVLTVNRILYNYDEFQDTNKLKRFEDFKISTYHLDFVEHYLKIMNNYFKQQHISNPQIYLSLKTLNQFASYFKYNTQRPGSPFPYMLVFQEETYKFLKNKECIIYKINLIANQFANLEAITQKNILQIWKQVKSKKTSIDQIQIEYYLNDDLCEEMLNQGYTERDILSLIRIIPPKSIRIQGGLSLSAVKGLYSILYDTHYFQYSIVAYSFETFLNTGIGYALRETAYNYQDKGQISKWIKTKFYNFFNFFVDKAETFEFDDEILNLNKYLSQRRLFFFLIAFNNIIFWIVTLFLPYYFNHYYSGDTTQSEKDYYCVNGTTKIANQVYYGFAGFSFIIEAFLVYQFQLQIPTHMDKMKINIQKRKSEKIKDQQNNQVVPDLLLKTKTVVEKKYRKMQRFIKFLVESKITSTLLFVINIVLSQLFKFDLYNDVTFILTCFYCNERILFILTLIITTVTQFIYISNYFYLLLLRLTQTETTAKILSTKFINDIYEIAFLGRNQALSTQLDKIAPYNVSVIPNNWITRKFFPNIAGRSMSNIVKAYFLQFTLEDLPQTIIQTYFAVKQAIKNGGLSSQVYLILIISLYNVFTSFYLFMSIRPSTLNQDIFDSLSQKKIKEYSNAKLSNLREEQQQIQAYTELYQSSSMASPIKGDDEEQQQLLLQQ